MVTNLLSTEINANGRLLEATEPITPTLVSEEPTTIQKAETIFQARAAQNPKEKQQYRIRMITALALAALALHAVIACGVLMAVAMTFPASLPLFITAAGLLGGASILNLINSFVLPGKSPLEIEDEERFWKGLAKTSLHDLSIPKKYKISDISMDEIYNHHIMDSSSEKKLKNFTESYYQMTRSKESEIDNLKELSQEFKEDAIKFINEKYAKKSEQLEKDFNIFRQEFIDGFYKKHLNSNQVSTSQSCRQASNDNGKVSANQKAERIFVAREGVRTERKEWIMMQVITRIMRHVVAVLICLPFPQFLMILGISLIPVHILIPLTIGLGLSAIPGICPKFSNYGYPFLTPPCPINRHLLSSQEEKQFWNLMVKGSLKEAYNATQKAEKLLSGEAMLNSRITNLEMAKKFDYLMGSYRQLKREKEKRIARYTGDKLATLETSCTKEEKEREKELIEKMYVQKEAELEKEFTALCQQLLDESYHRFCE